MAAKPMKMRALYYPYSRTVDETTLKRAVLLYDEVMFVDPVSPQVRSGLFADGQHGHLAADAARSLEREWRRVTESYDLLEREGLVRLVDPSPVLEEPARGDLVARALATDLDDATVWDLFSGRSPRTWSMLRSRIPQAAYAHLASQSGARTLFTGSGRRTRGERFVEGYPARQPWIQSDARRVDDGREYAALLPYPVGSSLATSTALALAVAHDAVPLTDSDPHFRLLSLRMARAAKSVPSAAEIPGLRARPSELALQKAALVQQRIVDSEISYSDLQGLSLEDCLRYRERTADEREQFRAFLRDVVRTTYTEPWSPGIEAVVAARIEAARREISDHKKSMRDSYLRLFKRALIGLSVTAAPSLVTTIFPHVSPLTALLFGGGVLTGGLLSDPLKDLMTLWAERDRKTNSLAYLMELPRQRADDTLPSTI